MSRTPVSRSNGRPSPISASRRDRFSSGTAVMREPFDYESMAEIPQFGPGHNRRRFAGGAGSTATSRKENRLVSLRPPRFELGTYGLEIRCSVQLSYGRRWFRSLTGLPDALHGSLRQLLQF